MFKNVRLVDSHHDVRVTGTRIVHIEPSGTLTPTPGETIREGGWLTPPMAEPHTHLDAALLGARRPNRSGTLREGIANWSILRNGLTTADVQERARTTLRMYAATGTNRVRTHVDTGSLLAVEALIDLREQVRSDGIELQIVAFPQEGIHRHPDRMANWRAAVALGVDAVGGIPHFERTTEEGWQSVRDVFDLAESVGAQVDFHCDESDDPHSRNLEVVCAETLDRGLQGRVVAGHCTALHSYNHPYAAKVIELVAEAGVQVIANPLDNTVLQGRYDRYPKRRGITRVDELWDAGAVVGIGHDSVQDPWYRFGTARMLDAAYMLIHVAQLTSESAMDRVFKTLWTDNHRPFGTQPVVELNAECRWLWWPHDDVADLMVHRPDPEIVEA